MAIESELTLFSARYSAFAQRVLIALKEKGIPFDLVDVDFSRKPKELLEANPIHEKVPTIVHNGKAVAESLVILHYLEDAWPQQVPLLPEDAYERSQMRFWADYIYQFFVQMLDNFFAKPDSLVRAAAEETMATVLRTLEEAMLNFSAEGPFFIGEKFGYLDVILAPVTVWLPSQEKMCGLSVPGADKLPRLHKWLEACSAHPSVKASLPTVDDSIALYQKVVDKSAAASAAEANHK